MDCDYHLPLGSVPGLLRNDMGDFDRTVKGYLKVDPELVEAKRTELNLEGKTYYLAHSMGFEDKLTQLTLTEAPKLSEGFIGCTNNEQGRHIISQLDVALEKIAHTQEYHDILVRWLPDNLKPILEKRLKDRNESAAH